MSGLISVQTDLQDIKAYLTNAGYQVVDMTDADRGIEAVVYTGELCGGTKKPLPSSAECFTVMVNAAGLSPEQVAVELANRLDSRNIQELA